MLEKIAVENKLAIANLTEIFLSENFNRSNRHNRKLIFSITAKKKINYFVR